MKYLLPVVALSILVGCAASSDVPAGSVVALTHGVSSRPQSSGPLLYVSDAGNDNVKFYTFPNGTLLGTLGGFGSVRGLCTRSNGDVFVVDAKRSEVVRYDHGAKTPSQILYDQEYYPNACAVDPINGQLAVTLQSESGDEGVLAIFAHADGRPVYYSTGDVYKPAYCAFDPKGNLYIDGTDRGGNFAFGYVPYGYDTVYNVTLNQAIAVAGGVQWDGTYVAVGDQGTGSNGSTIYRFSVNASGGTLEGTVTLDGSSDVKQFSIDATKLIGPNAGGSLKVKYWHYPAGGSAIKQFGVFKEPVAAVVSRV